MSKHPTKRELTLEIMSDGRVFLLGKQIPTRRATRGYHDVQLAVHRLVAMAFHGAPSSAGLVVDHIDGNPSNNDAANLRWVTQGENMRNRGLGRAPSLTRRQAAEILAAKPRLPMTLGDLAEAIGVSYSCVRAIRSGKNHTEGFSKTNRTVLTEANVSAIKAWHMPSPTAAQLARNYKVSATTIRSVWNGTHPSLP